MTNHVLVINNLVVQAMTGNPYDVFNKETAKKFIDAPDEVNVNWRYVDGEFIAPETPDEKQLMKIKNSEKAKNLLLNTDWVVLSDVSGEDCNPRLSNVSEFLDYRNALRNIAINPPDVEIVWLEKPTEQWTEITANNISANT